MSKIRLNKFTVERERWGENRGLYSCSASFSTKGMDFQINIGPELGEALVMLCKGHIAEASKEALAHLTLVAEGKEESNESL